MVSALPAPSLVAVFLRFPGTATDGAISDRPIAINNGTSGWRSTRGATQDRATTASYGAFTVKYPHPHRIASVTPGHTTSAPLCSPFRTRSRYSGGRRGPSFNPMRTASSSRGGSRLPPNCDSHLANHVTEIGSNGGTRASKGSRKTGSGAQIIQPFDHIQQALEWIAATCRKSIVSRCHKIWCRASEFWKAQENCGLVGSVVMVFLLMLLGLTVR